VPLASILLLAYLTGFFILFDGNVEVLTQDALVILPFSAIAVTLIVFLVVISKTLRVSSGGGKVATMLGATRLDGSGMEAPNRRLRNVVEEMAIASGMPVPDVYVLEREEAINAFAAGFSPADAAITVTQGAVRLLSRDELQGVIGHEFSHILNGDMRLYTRMLGPQHGLGVIASIGLALLRGHLKFSAGAILRMPLIILGIIGDLFKENPLAGVASVIFAPVWVPVVVGLILAVLAVMLVAASGVAILGFVGQQFARAIRGAVSRRREYLADASAVQFTRQTAGIVGALKKIGGYSKASYLTADDAEEVSHMLFGRGAERFVGFSTHPPIAERIKALDPTFREGDYPHVEPIPVPQVTEKEEPAEQPKAGIGFTGASEVAVVSPAEIVESVGQPSQAHIEYAKKLRQSIPENLYTAAHSIESSYYLTLALILDRSGKHLERQLTLIEEPAGQSESNLVRSLHVELANIGPEYRLPLLELVIPTLRRRLEVENFQLAELVHRLIEIDGDFDLYEFCFSRILRQNILLSPPGADGYRPHSRGATRDALANVRAAIARNGHENLVEAQAAFDTGKARLGKWAEKVTRDVSQEVTLDTLDKSLDTLRDFKGVTPFKLLLAIGETAAHDGRLTLAEAELIRVVCSTLDHPVPPILVAAL
jgi:Zn-dependent protease with chaperone function